jgi:WD40 repeat protein
MRLKFQRVYQQRGAQTGRRGGAMSRCSLLFSVIAAGYWDAHRPHNSDFRKTIRSNSRFAFRPAWPEEARGPYQWDVCRARAGSGQGGHMLKLMNYAALRWRALILATVLAAAGGACGLAEDTGSKGMHLQVAKLRSLATKVSPTGIAWSPDGSKIAAIHDFGGAISVWSASGDLIVSIKREVTTGPYVGSSLAFMPDSRTILAPAPTPTHSDISSLGLWDAESGALLRVLPAPTSDRIFQAVVARIFTLSPDGSLVAVRPIDSRGPISIYRTDNGSLVKIRQVWASETQDLKPFLRSDVPGITPSYEVTPSDFPEGVEALAFAPNNNELAVGLLTGSATIDVDPSSSFLRFVESPRKPIVCLAYTPDGKFLATGARSRMTGARDTHAAYLQIREASSGIVVVEDATVREVRGLAWDRDGQVLAVITDGDVLHLYRPFVNGNVHQDVPIATGAFTLSFSPTRSELAVSTETGIDFYSIR